MLRETALVTGPQRGGQSLCVECQGPDNGHQCPLCALPLCGPLCEGGTNHSTECHIYATNSNRKASMEQHLESLLALRLLLRKKKVGLIIICPELFHIFGSLCLTSYAFQQMRSSNSATAPPPQRHSCPT